MTNEELKKAKSAYQSQSYTCFNKKDKNGNPVRMLLTFDQWLDIWTTSGYWYQRGRLKGQYCMARKNDIGNYELGNVEIILSSLNSSMAPVYERTLQTREQLRQKYLGKPRPKEVIEKMITNRKSNIKIITPDGEFPTINSAARYYNVDPSTISYNAKRQRKGFSFAKN